MKEEKQLDMRLVEAIRKIEGYIEQTTGQAPSVEELEDALSKFFVLKEIREFIELRRQENG